MVGQLWGCRQEQWFYVAICTYSIEKDEKDEEAHFAEAHIRFGWTEWLDKMWKKHGFRFASLAILQGDTDVTKGFDPEKVAFRGSGITGIKIPELSELEERPRDEVRTCEMDLAGRSL